TATRESSIGDQRNLGGQAPAGNSAGWTQHLAHPGTAFRALVADDDYITRNDLPAQNGFQRAFFPVEYFRPTFENEAFLACYLGHGTGRGEVAVEHDQMAVALDRIGERANDILALRIGPHAAQVLRERASRDRHTVAVEQSLFEQRLHQRLDAAYAHQLRHRVATAWTEICEHRDALTYTSEVVNPEIHVGRMGERQQVQNQVGGAPERDRDGDGVLEGFAREDVRGQYSALCQPDDLTPGIAGVLQLIGRYGILGGAAGQAHAERFDCARHRIGGVHAAAAAGAGQSGFLDVLELALRDLSRRVLAYCLKHRDDVSPVFARPDRPAINEYRRSIQARERHHAAGHVLVAAADGEDAVESLGGGNGLDGVGNH